MSDSIVESSVSTIVSILQVPRLLPMAFGVLFLLSFLFQIGIFTRVPSLTPQSTILNRIDSTIASGTVATISCSIFGKAEEKNVLYRFSTAFQFPGDSAVQNRAIFFVLLIPIILYFPIGLAYMIGIIVNKGNIFKSSNEEEKQKATQLIHEVSDIFVTLILFTFVWVMNLEEIFPGPIIQWAVGNTYIELLLGGVLFIVIPVLYFKNFVTRVQEALA